MDNREFTISFTDEEPDGRVYILIRYKDKLVDLQLTPTDVIAGTPSWDRSDFRDVPELEGTDFRGFIKILTAVADSVDSR